jgi:vitamin-K-epoxide reductase (warfarin-sensitive)
MQAAVSDEAIESSKTESRRNRVLFICISILSLAGTGVSAVSLQRHYAKSTTQFCDFAQRFSCDIVNRSEYSRFAGIPVAAIGIAGYGFLFVLSAFSRRRPETTNRLLLAAIAGLLFAVRLTYIEAYTLETWCILCLLSLALILLITVLATIVKLAKAAG